MINVNKNNDELNMCNSCHNRDKKELFDIHIEFNNSGSVITLCTDCIKELLKKINNSI